MAQKRLLHRKTSVGEISAANAILALLLLKPEDKYIIRVKANVKQNQVRAEMINKGTIELLDKLI